MSCSLTSCAAEALERDPLDARGALELGEHGTQRMAAVELVGAVRGEQEERLGPRVADEEDEEVARGGVGPVEVLDHQRDGAEPVEAGRAAPRTPAPGSTRRAPTRRAAAAPRRAARRGTSCRRAPGSGRRGPEPRRAPRTPRRAGSCRRPTRRPRRRTPACGRAPPRAWPAPRCARRRCCWRRGGARPPLWRPCPRGARSPAGAAGAEPAGDRGGGRITALAAREPAAGAAEAAVAGGAVDALLDELGGDDSCVERVHGGHYAAEAAPAHREVAPT